MTEGLCTADCETGVAFFAVAAASVDGLVEDILVSDWNDV